MSPFLWYYKNKYWNLETQEKLKNIEYTDLMTSTIKIPHL